MRQLGHASLLLLAAVVFLGANTFRCEPLPETGLPSIETDAAHYLPGQPVQVTVSPNGSPMEIAGQYGFPIFHVERLGERGVWQAVRTLFPMGCHPTDCVDGQPLVMCVDPGPPFCAEHAEPFTWDWDGHIYRHEQLPCGDTTIEVPERVAALPGLYRVRLNYGDDPRPGDAPPFEDCVAQDRELITETFEIGWLPDSAL